MASPIPFALMETFIAKARMLWVTALFFLQIFLFLPFYAAAGAFHKTKGRQMAARLNQIFSWMLYTLSFMRPKVRSKLPKNALNAHKSYIICANHTSFLDIPALALTRFPMVFVGKTAVSKYFPLFRYIYQFHVHFDRGSLRGRHTAFVQAAKVLRSGLHVAFFPEGGIKSQQPPLLAPFQNGAFRLAIETETPVLPVALVNNWIIAPKYRVCPSRLCPIITHILEPIPTKGLTLDDTAVLRQQVREALHNALCGYHPKALTPTTIA